jgi:hypothetical protein
MVTNFAKKQLLLGGFNLTTDTIKVALLNSSHSDDPDTLEYFDDVSTNEISGTGYTAGGKTLSSKSVSQDNTNNLAKFDAADVEWDPLTASNIRYACVYKYTGTNSTSPILCIIDFGSAYSPSGGLFKIIWGDNGIFRIRNV